MNGTLTIGELFVEAADRHGAREALVYRDDRWTYGELAGWVNTACEQLAAMAARPPRRVALIGANHPAYVIGYFAAQVLGASTVEIGRDESLENVLQALRVTGADVVLTDRTDVLAASPAPALEFGAFVEDVAALQPQRYQRALHAARVAADEKATVVFTSGTTGAPKGVALSHRNVLFVVAAVCEYLSLGPADRYALVLPLAHTYGKSNLLSALAVGATVVFVENPHDPSAFFARMAQERCTVLSVVPFHLNILARRGAGAVLDGVTLRAITSSGGPLAPGTADAVAAILPQTRLFCMYGLTESATRLTFLPPEWLSAKPGSVGRPLPGVRIQIRDEEGGALPAGSVGHVWANGPNVMLGYVAEPELTAATIVDGWLRTGDLGYLDDDECLFLTGRDKDIIKVAGERISPAEIDEVLLSHPAVADAAVRGMPDSLLGETVWAYVVTRPGANIADLASFCAARLSPHKVPRKFLETARIPRTPTGKIRRFLLTPD